MVCARNGAVMNILVLMEAKNSNLVVPKNSNHESQKTSILEINNVSRYWHCPTLLKVRRPPINQIVNKQAKAPRTLHYHLK